MVLVKPFLLGSRWAAAIRDVTPSGAAQARAEREQHLELAHPEQPAGDEVDADRRGERRAERDELGRERPAERRVERMPDEPRDERRPQPTRPRPSSPSSAIARAVEPADAPAQQDEQRRRAGDVADRRRERDPPRADAVERDVEDHVQEEVAERDRRSASSSTGG